MNNLGTDVIVVGAGPTGLTLANELALADVDVVVLERLPERTGLSKALNLQPRTAEMLELRGLLDGVEERSFTTVRDGHFAMIPVVYDGWDTRFPFQLGIPQAKVEEFLEEQLAAQGTKVLRGSEVLTFVQDKDSVSVRYRTDSGEAQLYAKFLVGCDGARSVVRKGLGVDFPGVDGEGFGVVADVLFDKAPDAAQKQWRTMRNIGEPTGATTFKGLIPLGEPGLYRFIYGDRASRPADMRSGISHDEVRTALLDSYGDTATVSEIRWASRFSDTARQAAHYRDGRVLLAGDAAHIHFPAGGQGLNLGVQDAMNLGWKLAATVRGWADDDLLDTYEAERHPVGAQVLHNVAAQLGLTPRSHESRALRALFGDLAALPEVNRYLSGMVSGLGIRYPTYGTAHPALGARLNDQHVLTETGPLRPSTLFRTGDFVLLTTTAAHTDAARSQATRLTTQLVADLPWPSTEAVLYRPDGYACWVAPTPTR
ncbi:FAD-dependent monooxygenase [Amycolatopsis regifaucium]|uniref:FAD-dependent oxidoreductase n=1 Tax=Amycolatopsis regifaucium TaxID=546365 RepID=A0A154MR96_9PSEU|nr:FAD-dependent monooxygenase [Amycolatopsis regifaucium]KZB86814.1 FAD-dependent oxidoreductase [Amycolatopsis regifaucium]OKA09244.1 FAD-dependent oxidoreductase [Amycolatopsis regifaucium]SFH56624.1 2-polyprenyl-6-methoxyphenol hydroxylase [Amycolatopsis regifaucium]